MIKIQVNTANIRVLHTETITAGRVGLALAMSFSEEWDDLTKIAVFQGVEARDVEVLSGVVTVPFECVATGGPMLMVGLRGENEDGTVVIPTVWAPLGEIIPAVELSDEEGREPTPSIVAQIQRTAESAVSKAQSVVDAAERGDFNGAPGPEGPAGADGPQGEIGAPGFSPAVSVERVFNGVTITATDEEGTTIATVYDGTGAVNSVNGMSGTVVLDAEDVGAVPDDTPLFSGDYNDLTNKPTIPSLDGYATETYVDAHHDSTKQDAVSDLSTIRSGAALGATAVQPAGLAGYATEAYVDSHHDASKQDVISDLTDIRSGAALGATALQSYTETDPTVPAWAKEADKPSYGKAEVGLGNVDNVRQFSASNLPPAGINLLDNPWFQINQRGASSYSGTGYTIDRWYSYYSATTVTANSDGTLSIKDNSSTDPSALFQYLETPLTPNVSYTLTADVVSGSLDFGLYDENWNYISTVQNGSSFSVSQNNVTRIGMYIAQNSTAKVKAVKLEKGTVSTLSQDTMPNYEEELLRCQRFFYRLQNNSSSYVLDLGVSVAPSTTQARVAVKLPISMRVNPSVSYSTVNVLKLNTTVSASDEHSSSALSGYNASKDKSIRVIYGTFSGLTAGEAYRAYLPASSEAYIDFIADL